MGQRPAQAPAKALESSWCALPAVLSPWATCWLHYEGCAKTWHRHPTYFSWTSLWREILGEGEPESAWVQGLERKVVLVITQDQVSLSPFSNTNWKPLLPLDKFPKSSFFPGSTHGPWVGRRVCEMKALFALWNSLTMCWEKVLLIAFRAFRRTSIYLSPFFFPPCVF